MSPQVGTKSGPWQLWSLGSSFFLGPDAGEAPELRRVQCVLLARPSPALC